jgi:hypothetical protein
VPSHQSFLDKGGDDKSKVPDVAPEIETDEDAVLQAAGSQPLQQEAPAPPEEEDVLFAKRAKMFRFMSSGSD